MVFYKDLKDQEYLFPPNIKDLIDDDHICHVVDVVRSSRILHENVRVNAIYIFLAGKLTPDFRTISDFRKNNSKLVLPIIWAWFA